MAPGRKQGAGCWTCRLRRKRCDSVQPICGNCQNLEITCYSVEAKPPWMDGGAAQKQMSEMIKGTIKQNAILRRERRTQGDQGSFFALEEDCVSYPNAVTTFSSTCGRDNVDKHVPPAESTISIPSANPVRPTATQPSINQAEASLLPFTSASSTSGPVILPSGSSSVPSSPAGFAIPINAELGSVMIYLDYVFPFLFPFYQPSLLETGRQWLLGLLCQNEASFHIAASLSAYFFSLVPQGNGRDMHDDCKALVRDKLMEQMDMTFKSIQSTVSAASRHGAQSSLLDRIRIMEEITQLLIVEVTVRRHVQWTVHLTPALVLFDEIFQSHSTGHSKPSLPALMSALPSPFPMGTPHHKPLPNTADQSALVFFVSLLLFIDIIASTSLCTSPVLQNYHDSNLAFHGETTCCVELENVVGCQNWALVAIGNISALCAWKRDAKHNGNFSIDDLVKLAGPISQALEAGLTTLNTGATRSQPKKTSGSRLEAYYSWHIRAINCISTADVTRIWAYAAKIYLFVCLWGWQVYSTDIQASVNKILCLSQNIESPAQLRSLSWPICVAGCLAISSQENDFRCVLGSMGQLGEFGTVSNALHIMEAVWTSRATIDGNVWDLASCLSILGSATLLL
ncbi:MAG: hypothetical protein M1812_008067 [Candelaria pacifica]|nr:MAG: hypothetical protein M1812_008067 [Candelaria pacifica]